VLCLVLFSLLQGQPSFAVLDGKTVIIPDTPDEALIRRVTVRLVKRSIDGSYHLWCSGVITGPTEITSAGHCPYMSESRLDSLRTGRIFAEIRNPKTGKLQYIQVTDGRGEFGGKVGQVDLALLKLARAVPEGVSIPIGIGQCDNRERISAGFGLDEKGNSPTTLKIAHYSEVGREEQERVINAEDDEIPIVETTSTAIAKSGKMCKGDSGGPIFCKVNGRLVLDSVVSANVGSPANHAPTRSENKQLSAGSNLTTTCENRRYLTRDRISNSLDRIKTWREQLEGQENEDSTEAQH
jgi:hypothetical protein